MKKIFDYRNSLGILFLIFALVFALGSCEVEEEGYTDDANIVVYGNCECANTTNMLDALAKAQITYTFHDVNKDSKANTQMWKKIKNQSWYSDRVYIIFPVVDVCGKIFNFADFYEVKGWIDKSGCY